MTMEPDLQAFAELLEELEIPISNGEFLELTECPYLAFFVTENHPVMADGVPICVNAAVELHLITKGIRSYTLECDLEELLAANGYPFTADYTQNIEQRIYEVTYQTTIFS